MSRNCESFYESLDKLGMIEKEKVVKEPRRCREKFNGYMWEAEKKVTLVDGRVLVFYLWHHYCNDPGNDWKPVGRELDVFFTLTSIKIDGCFQDAYGHVIYDGQKVYGTKKSMSMNEEYRSIVKKKIFDGSWKEDDNIFLVL